MVSQLPIISASDRERKYCPFYGFSGIGGMLLDTEGNQCACTGAHAPCYREIGSEPVDWKTCNYNTEDARKTLHERADTTPIFPKELRPKDTTSWEGISLADWYERIMGSPL